MNAEQENRLRERQRQENNKRDLIEALEHIEKLEQEKEEMLKCMIWDFKANVKQLGLEKSKMLNSRYVIEQITGKTIEEVINES